MEVFYFSTPPLSFQVNISPLCPSPFREVFYFSTPPLSFQVNISSLHPSHFREVYFSPPFLHLSGKYLSCPAPLEKYLISPHLSSPFRKESHLCIFFLFPFREISVHHPSPHLSRKYLISPSLSFHLFREESYFSTPPSPFRKVSYFSTPPLTCHGKVLLFTFSFFCCST